MYALEGFLVGVHTKDEKGEKEKIETKRDENVRLMMQKPYAIGRGT